MAPLDDLDDLDALVERATKLAAAATGVQRSVLGITGAPGSGKSTLTEALVSRLLADGVRVAPVGMDGFHLAQRELERLGRTARKGAADTFDVDGYVTLLARLRARADHPVYAPEFRRDLEEPVGSAVPVLPETDLVVTEGNYLLVDDGGWERVRPLLDECWFIAPDEDVRHERLAERHRRHGRTPDAAWERTMGSDETNALLSNSTQSRADLVLGAR
ncbi:nucleoside/nucleotide kinase family protein [Angustibacter aerolatus]